MPFASLPKKKVEESLKLSADIEFESRRVPMYLIWINCLGKDQVDGAKRRSPLHLRTDRFLCDIKAAHSNLTVINKES